MSISIPLTNASKSAIIDDDRYNATLYNWGLQSFYNGIGRIVSTNYQIEGKYVKLSNLVMGNHTVMYDHKDQDPYNCQRNNLRKATQSQNLANRSKRDTFKPCSSQYKGVRYVKRLNKWTAQITYKGKSIYLGLYKQEIEAAKRYDEAALKYFKEFACINFAHDSKAT